MPLSKLLLSGAILLSLTACGAPLLAPPTPLPVKLVPPLELIQDRTKPELKGRSNADLAVGFQERGVVIDELNADKAALRAWSK